MKHRVRDRAVVRDPKAAGKAVQTMSQCLLTRASISFEATDSAKKVVERTSVPSDLRLKQAAKGYADCLYKQLLYNRNDCSAGYSLGEARRLAEVTQQQLEQRPDVVNG